MTRLGEQETVIRDQAETIGRQGAELEAARERGKSFHADLERARAELAAAEASRRRDHRRLSIALVAVCSLLVVTGTLAGAGWAW